MSEVIISSIYVSSHVIHNISDRFGGLILYDIPIENGGVIVITLCLSIQ